MNADLILEKSCPEFPQGMCAEIVGNIDDELMNVSCRIDTLVNDSGVVHCEAEGLTFALDLNMFTGAPPSSFNFTADPQQYPVTFSWVDAGFASHKDGTYASAQTHEFAFRSAGVVYEEELTDKSRLTYVAGSFAVNWKKRPTCPTCPDVRLLGTFTVLTSE